MMNGLIEHIAKVSDSNSNMFVFWTVGAQNKLVQSVVLLLKKQW